MMSLSSMSSTADLLQDLSFLVRGSGDEESLNAQQLERERKEREELEQIAVEFHMLWLLKSLKRPNPRRLDTS